MSFEGYEAFDDPYYYKGTKVLRNKLRLRDPQKLESFELEMTTLRAKEPVPTGQYDPAHYCRVHRHLFQDVYSWAGKYRTVWIAKGGNSFCYPAHIASAMNKVFADLGKSGVFETTDRGNFISDIAQFLAELNAIHPFREGNGRSQLSFIAMIGARTGFQFDLSRIERDQFLPAMIASFSGDLTPLIRQLTSLLRG